MIHLRPHQLTAQAELLPILRKRRVAYLRGEVRTGKTLTALAVARELQVPSVLVLTKKKAIASIEKDASAIGMGGIVAVTNYEAIHKLPQQAWGLIVFDEAHGLGAYPKPSNRTVACKALRASYKLLMSGTPTPESYSQMYHQWWALGRGPWGHANFYAWAKDYVRIQQVRVGGGQTVNDYSDADGDRIMADLVPYTVNMTQQDAGITTTIEERTHVVPMSDRTVRLMRRIAKDGIIGGAPHSRKVEAGTAAAEMSKLRQLASGTVKWTRILPCADGIPVPVEGHTIIDRSKARHVIDRILPTGKTAILYTFVAEGEMLRAMVPNWTDVPEVFNADPAATFIGQVQSSREGVNLSTAANIVFFGIDYSALSYLQGRDRATYVGRTTPPVLHWLLAEGSIEPRVKEVVTSKETYTVNHYRHDKESITQGGGDTGADREAVGGLGLDGDPPDDEQQARVARPAGGQGWQGDLFGGQAAGGEAHGVAGAPARGAGTSAGAGAGGGQRGGYAGGAGPAGRAGSGETFLSCPPPWGDRYSPLPRGRSCDHCHGRGYSRRWWVEVGVHVAIGGRLARNPAKEPDPLPCPYCGEPRPTGAGAEYRPWRAWEQAAGLIYNVSKLGCGY